MIDERDGWLPGVRRIAVLRAGGMGDVLLTLPAVQALKDRYPDAMLTLITTPAAARLLDGRPGPVDDTLALPVVAGVHEPAGAAEDRAATDRFVADAAHRGYDLAVQLHGGGRWSNPFVRRLGARLTAGGRTPDAEPLDRWLPYRYYQHTTLRALELVGLVGAAPAEPEPRVAVLPADLAAADRVLDGLPRPVLTVHPGATDPRRRWPAERFAEVITAVAHDGAGVVVIGSPDEAVLVQHVTRLAQQRLPTSSCGSVRPFAAAAGGRGLDESALVGVLARSAALLGNDSGPRHLAGAVGIQTVSVYWTGNVINAGPLTRARHSVHIGWTVDCPVCGRRNATAVDFDDCGHQVSYVGDIGAAAVVSDVRAALGASRARLTPVLDQADATPA